MNDSFGKREIRANDPTSGVISTPAFTISIASQSDITINLLSGTRIEVADKDKDKSIQITLSANKGRGNQKKPLKVELSYRPNLQGPICFNDRDFLCYDAFAFVDVSSRANGSILECRGALVTTSRIQMSPGGVSLEITPHNTAEFKAFPPANPELHWMASLFPALTTGQFEEKRVALVTDTELDLHGEFNSRTRPIIQDKYLPSNIDLIYASSDSRRTFLNRVMHMCDQLSKGKPVESTWPKVNGRPVSRKPVKYG